MRKISYTINKIALPGYFNPVLHLITKRHKLPLSSGNNDTITVRVVSDNICVLSINSYLEYIGLQVFNMETGEEIGNMFLQDEWNIKEALGNNALNKSEPWLIRALLDYI